MEQDEIIIDGPLLAHTVRRQLRGWLWKGPLLLTALLLLALLLVPRSYTSITSVAMQQPTPSGGLASLLGGAGGGAGNKHYIGVLKSRELALQVERRVHLQQIYGFKELPTPEAAAARLEKGVKPDDNADGLLYIAVTLPGPPKLGLRQSPRPKQIEDAAAQAANAYALALKNYFVSSDNDQGSVLLRGADAEVRRARAGYNQAQGQLRNFSRALARANPRSAGASPRPGLSPSAGAAPGAGTSPGADTDAVVASSGLGALYARYDEVQTDLHAAQAARLTRETRTAEQLRNLSRLPTDDPQLSDIRTRVSADQIAYDTARNIYGPENSAVIRAQTQLQSDQQQLSLQTQGVREGLTTADIVSDQQIKALYARQATLSEKIMQAERRLGVSRNLSFESGRLQAELGFQAEILRATLVTAQTIKLNTASAQSRMTIIDSAIPPPGGEPGMTKLGLLCFLLVLLAFGVSIVLDYLRGTRASSRQLSPTSLANGSSANLPAEAEEPASFVSKH